MHSMKNINKVTYVPQEKKPTTNERTKTTVRYLKESLDEKAIRGAIETYWQKEPQGDEVVLAALEVLDDKGLHKIIQDMTEIKGIERKTALDTVKKHLGIYIAILLVEMHGKEIIGTARDKEGRNLAKRVPYVWQTKLHHLNLDLKSFTPHVRLDFR